MKLQEICQQEFEGNFHNPYALRSCWQNDFYCSFIGSQKTAAFLALQNSKNSNSNFINMDWNTVYAPTHIPTISIVKKIDMTVIYKNSSVTERQILVLDPLYATEFARLPKDPQIVCISWPSSIIKRKYFNNEIVLAVVNHFGACEIFTKNSLKNDFTVSRILINDLFHYIFDHKLQNIKKIEPLKECIEDFCITYCCWTNVLEDDNDDNVHTQLLCSTESGWILGFNIVPWKAKFVFKFMTEMKSIKFLKSFSFVTNGIKKHLLFVSNSYGILKIYEIHKDDIKEISILWNTDDKMCCQCVDVEYHENIDKLLITTTKGSHFLAFVISSDGKVCTRGNRYVGNFVITGMQRANTFEYILCTINGYTEYINILYDNKLNTLTIDSNIIQHNLMIDNNQILGMITTINKVGWLFALFRNKFKAKYYGYLSLCSINVIEPLGILLYSKNYNMENYHDCIEIIRLKLIAKIDSEQYINFIPKLKQFNEDILHGLRIKKIIINGIVAQYRKMHINKPCAVDKELECIDDTIFALYFYDRLKYLFDLKCLTEFQNLSGKYMKQMLLNYSKKNDSIEEYTNIKNVLVPIIDSLLLENDQLLNDDNSNEECIYCGEKINLNTMMCSNNHNMPRCCITLVQVQMFTKRHCSQCKRVALDNDSLLKEILNTNDDFLCPYCAIPFVIQQEIS